jgi:HEAT repeat protein
MDHSRTSPSLRRWKLATAISGATCVVLAMRQPAPVADHAPHTAAGVVRTVDGAPATVLRRLQGQLRSKPDEAALLARIASARSAAELEKLCAQLGFVGGDASVDALTALAADPRWEVGRAAIAALGRIGTARAVDVLIDLTEAGPSWQVRAALAGLATAGTQPARDRVTEAALATGRYRVDAIEVLADLEGGDVIGVLSTIAGQGDPEATVAAIATAARLGTTAARDLIHRLADSPDRRIRAAALRAMSPEDPATRELLADAAAGDDPGAATAAVEALGYARETSAVPMLARLAHAGTKETRVAALDALATIGNADAMAALTTLAAGTGGDATAAARALARRGDETAARALVAAIEAQPAGRVRVDLLKELNGLPGDEVDELFREVAQSATGPARGVALAHLDSIRDPEAVSLAIEIAAQGGRAGYDGILTLQHSTDPDAFAALVALAGKDDAVGADALDALVSRAGTAPEVTSLLVERMRSGRGEQAASSAAALAAAGTPEARAALLDVLHGKDAARAAEVAGTLLEAGEGPDGQLRDALTEVARADPRPKVRGKAVAELVEAGSAGGSDLARQALLHGDAELATSVIGELKGQDSAEALALLESAARVGRTTEARTAAVEAVAAKSDPSSITLFGELARDASPEVRASALAGLADIDTEDAIDQLIALSPRGGEAETELIDRLRWSVQPAAHDELATLIRGKDPALAVQTIERLYKQSATLDAALRGALAGDDVSVATAAARRLRDNGAALTAEEAARVAELAVD